MKTEELSFSKIILATASGGILEWFDFTLFGILSKLVAEKFFPSQNLSLSMLSTFAAFAVGFFARPLGAVMMGHFGDKYGRKKTFLFTIVIMVISTAGIGLLPTYKTLGVFSPILLVIMRLLQGISVSGEHGGAITYLSEYAKPKSRGLLSAIPVASALGGMLLASICGFLLTAIFSETQIDQWAWRLPFLLSLILGGIAWYLRRKMKETTTFLNLMVENKIERVPVKKIFANHRRRFFLITLSFLISAAYPYLLFFYLPNATERFLHENISSKILILNSISLVVGIVFFLISAKWSDKYNRVKVMRLFAAISVIITFPLFVFFPLQNIWNLFVFQLIGTIVFACFTGPWPAAAAESFPDQVRFSGIALSLNLSASIFGGTAPFILTSFQFTPHWELFSGLYFTLISLGSFLAIIFGPFRKNKQGV
ncbi:MAG: MFS transporter [Bacteroidales bacterium]